MCVKFPYLTEECVWGNPVLYFGTRQYMSLRENVKEKELNVTKVSDC